ncbi:MAG: pyridoxamine 5'-phosphate oxidase family protein, partial [Rhodoglobus sp.]
EFLEAGDYARLAVTIDGGVDIFPVNYLVTDSVIYFRSAPGSKLVAITEHPEVAFEVDGTHQRKRWSVVVKGQARRLGKDAEIEASGVLGLRTASPTVKWNYVRIAPAEISGRRFAARA